MGSDVQPRSSEKSSTRQRIANFEWIWREHLRHAVKLALETSNKAHRLMSGLAKDAKRPVWESGTMCTTVPSTL